MIIDTSYFNTPQLFIPNAVVQPLVGNNMPTNIDRLESVIEDMECQLLVNALGIEQYNDLISQFDETGNLKDDALAKWVDLVNGKGNWIGLRPKIKQQSLIAQYIFYNFLIDDDFFYTTTGIVKQQSENAVAVNSTSKAVRY